MQRLRGMDAFLVYGETPASPYVTLKVAIYSKPASANPPSGDDIIHFIKTHIVTAEGWRTDLRILRVPLDIHHPVWLADPDFDPDNHIRQSVLPAPGSKEQFCDFLYDLMSRPLDLERPPWEIWLLEGLQDDRVAIVFKLHHVLADGKTMAAVIENSHSGELAGDEANRDSERDAIPGKSKLIAGAFADLLRSYTTELPRYYRALSRARHKSQSFEEDDGDLVQAFTAPYVGILNKPGGAARVYRYETFNLADIKGLSKHFDCTINTLILAICAQALAHYLNDHGELPESSLITAIALGGEDIEEDLDNFLDSNILNNHVATAILPLHQNIPDFAERLERIKHSSKAAIEHARHSRGRRLEDYLDYVPAFAVRLMTREVLKRGPTKGVTYVNTIISNVPGPKSPLYALDGGLELVELASTGNLSDGSNLNITVWSYVDKITFSFYMREGCIPEPDKLVGYLKSAVEELFDQSTEGD